MIEKFYMVTYSTLPMQMGFASEVKGWSVIVNPMRSMALLELLADAASVAR